MTSLSAGESRPVQHTVVATGPVPRERRDEDAIAPARLAVRVRGLGATSGPRWARARVEWMARYGDRIGHGGLGARDRGLRGWGRHGGLQFVEAELEVVDGRAAIQRAVERRGRAAVFVAMAQAPQLVAHGGPRLVVVDPLEQGQEGPPGAVPVAEGVVDAGGEDAPLHDMLCVPELEHPGQALVVRGPRPGGRRCGTAGPPSGPGPRPGCAGRRRPWPGPPLRAAPGGPPRTRRPGAAAGPSRCGPAPGRPAAPSGRRGRPRRSRPTPTRARASTR